MINMARNIKSKTAKNGKNANRSLLNPDLDANLWRIKMEYELLMILQILPAIVLGDNSIQPHFGTSIIKHVHFRV